MSRIAGPKRRSPSRANTRSLGNDPRGWTVSRWVRTRIPGSSRPARIRATTASAYPSRPGWRSISAPIAPAASEATSIIRLTPSRSKVALSIRTQRSRPARISSVSKAPSGTAAGIGRALSPVAALRPRWPASTGASARRCSRTRRAGRGGCRSAPRAARGSAGPAARSSLIRWASIASSCSCLPAGVRQTSTPRPSLGSGSRVTRPRSSSRSSSFVSPPELNSSATPSCFGGSRYGGPARRRAQIVLNSATLSPNSESSFSISRSSRRVARTRRPMTAIARVSSLGTSRPQSAVIRSM